MSDRALPDMPAGSDSLVKACAAGQTFCAGSKLYRCAPSGAHATLVKECAYTAEGFKHRCVACPGGAAACGPDVPASTVKMTGLATINMTIIHGCTKGVSLSFGAGPMKEAVGHLFVKNGDAGPIFNCGLTKSVFGENRWISYKDASKKLSCKTWSWGMPTLPPKIATFSFSTSPSKAGLPYTVTADGYLTCDSGQTWKKFTYQAKSTVGLY